jgi:hypothetical protein
MRSDSNRPTNWMGVLGMKYIKNLGFLVSKNVIVIALCDVPLSTVIMRALSELRRKEASQTCYALPLRSMKLVLD